MTKRKNFYLPIINLLKRTTNLSKIQKELDISKQQLNYYLRKLRKEGYVYRRSQGWYEITDRSKNMTKYDKFLIKDITRGHAYVWKIELKEIEGWNNRIKLLEKKKFRFKLVGAKENTPRIKVLGRKVWLCNDHIRVFDKPGESYYGRNAVESRKSSFYEILLITGVLNKKLGIKIKPEHIFYQKEHYALIKNDLAIDCNKKRETIHVSDEYGRWLSVDDSLGQGGELENEGKKALPTNIKMQKWWNDHKKNDFKVTPTFLMENINQVTNNQLMFAENMKSHIEAIQTLSQAVKDLQEQIKKGSR